MEKRIVITRMDRERLHETIKAMERVFAVLKEDEAGIRMLKEELDCATVVEPEAVPNDVVTMNTLVTLRDLNTGRNYGYQVVFPEDSDATVGKVSVLAPLGRSLFGCRLGDMIDVQAPGGLRRLHVREILYQPEAAGDFSR